MEALIYYCTLSWQKLNPIKLAYNKVDHMDSSINSGAFY